MSAEVKKTQKIVMVCFTWCVDELKMSGNADHIVGLNIKPSTHPEKFSSGEIAEIRKYLVEQLSVQLGVSKCTITFTNLLLLAPEEEVPGTSTI